MAPQNALLERSTFRPASSRLVDAIAQSNAEIMRRGRLLRSNGEGLAGDDLMRYCSLAGDMGYKRMERIGSEILAQGGTFLVVEIVDVVEIGGSYALRFVESKTEGEFTLPCRRELRQYTGGSIDLHASDALHDYMGKQVTVDISRRGSGYEVSMIGLAKDVLEDAVQATPLNILN